MCAVTHKAKPYQLVLLFKKHLDDVMGTLQSACEATLQYQYKNTLFSLIYAYGQKVLLIYLKKCAFYII